MNWKEVTMSEAIEFSINKIIDKNRSNIETPDFDAESLFFTDGTAIACKSNVKVNSQYTPDDILPPNWWIGQ